MGCLSSKQAKNVVIATNSESNVSSVGAGGANGMYNQPPQQLAPLPPRPVVGQTGHNSVN